MSNTFFLSGFGFVVTNTTQKKLFRRKNESSSYFFSENLFSDQKVPRQFSAYSKTKQTLFWGGTKDVHGGYKRVQNRVQKYVNKWKNTIFLACTKLSLILFYRLFYRLFYVVYVLILWPSQIFACTFNKLRNIKKNTFCDF